ncbi:9855_t:CDS:2 [Rhizophagus irregularis]|nr:9855_t:CDS:2 [Rhizophagus irregularis]
MKEIYLTVNDWCFNSKNDAEFKQAEAKREKLVESKKIGPEFAEKCHPEAIYTNYNYISKEEELDIDIESLSSQNLTIQTFSTSLKKRSNEELNLETYDNRVEKRIKTG